MTAEDVLREFVADVRAAAGDEEPHEWLRDTEVNWPDLADTYNHALVVLDRFDRTHHAAQNPLQITKWIRTGELDVGEDSPCNFRDLIEGLGNLLDHACSHDIFGDIVFEAEDGNTYVATVEGNIDIVNPDYLKEILAEDVAEG